MLYLRGFRIGIPRFVRSSTVVYTVSLQSVLGVHEFFYVKRNKLQESTSSINATSKIKLLFFRSVSLVPVKSNLGKGTTAVKEKILASSLLVIQ